MYDSQLKLVLYGSYALAETLKKVQYSYVWKKTLRSGLHFKLLHLVTVWSFDFFNCSNGMSIQRLYVSIILWSKLFVTCWNLPIMYTKPCRIIEKIIINSNKKSLDETTGSANHYTMSFSNINCTLYMFQPNNMNCVN